MHGMDAPGYRDRELLQENRPEIGNVAVEMGWILLALSRF
jgi:hypothetical protein